MTLIIVIGFLFMIIGGFYLSIKYENKSKAELPDMPGA